MCSLLICNDMSKPIVTSFVVVVVGRGGGGGWGLVGSVCKFFVIFFGARMENL